MPDEIKRIPISEFRERGYLHEINRLVLHPLGLALEVVVDEGGVEHLGGVWDYREDAEGMYYGEDLLNADKARKVCDELMGRREARIEKLGYVVQPIPDERVLITNYIGGDPPPRVYPDVEFEQ